VTRATERSSRYSSDDLSVVARSRLQPALAAYRTVRDSSRFECP
jgi:hypothetical protein